MRVAEGPLKMNETYEGHGIRFRYPAHWELSEQPGDDATSITVESPETSSWTVSLFFDGPSPEEVVDSAVQAFREEYDEVDVYPVEDQLGSHRSVAPTSISSVSS